MYIQHKAAMVFQKRDNMGFDISPALIIFLVILGAGFAVCCGFAIMRFYGEDPDERHWTKRTPEQDAYMREVRILNMKKLSRGGVRNMHAIPDQNMAHTPLSPR
jgi:hypothetical protein